MVQGLDEKLDSLFERCNTVLENFVEVLAKQMSVAPAPTLPRPESS
jgi:hypothetical protein